MKRSTAAFFLLLLSSSARASQPQPPDGGYAPIPPENSAPGRCREPREPPLAGFHNGLFYLRDKSDVFRLYVEGRVHVDGVAWLGPGVTSLDPGNALKPTFFLRRVRPELAGELFSYWQWQLGIDLAPSTADNQTGKTDQLNCAVNGAGALACTPQTSPVQAPLQKPAPTDAFINFGPTTWFNLQVGQFYLPFTMENRISDNTTPFLERSLAVRNIGAPLTRDIGAMAWGESPNRRLYYALGVFNGDGPNRPNQDSNFDYVARAVVHPFRETEVGVSARWGLRDDRLVGYDMPTMTTQGGFAFWRPTYTDTAGKLVHVIPAGDQLGLGLDVYLPIGPFDLIGELVYASSGTREAVDGYQLSNVTARAGALSGYGWYIEAGVWVLGSREIIGFPSYGKPQHADLKAPQKAARQGVEILAKLERLTLRYSGASRSGTDDPNTPDGTIDVMATTLGVNYWATRHLRVALNYGYYVFPNSAPVGAQGAWQRAISPAQTLAKGIDDTARLGGHDLHEVSVRFGVQF